MNVAIRKAIARIDVTHQGKSVGRGTGSLVTDRLVLTALHVVANRQTVPPVPYPGTITLTFPAHTTEAVICKGRYDVQSDWVLLECLNPPPARPLPLGELNESGAAFETFGFPDIQPIDGMVQRGTVENHDAELFGAKALQLFSNQAAAGDGAPIHGSSGSPVVVDNALVGVLRAALLNQQQVTRAGTLYACPLHAVMDRAGDLLPVPDPCHGLPGLRRRPLPTRPFTYLNRFTAADAEILFGRNRDIRQLYDRLTAEEAAPLVLLYGQAGVGKSSFLEAGVLPRLEWTYEVRYVRRDRHERLLQTVRRAIGDVEQETGRPLVLILDQIEEIYTQAGARRDELPELAAGLAALFRTGNIRPQSRIVLSFRKEWFPEVQKALEDCNLSYGKVFLDRLDRESVIEVVNGLTRSHRLRDHYGLSVETRLPEVIADDLQEDRDSAIAPTLRILLSKMWEQETARNRTSPAFTLEMYQRLKREGVLLGDFLDQQIARLADDRPADVASGFVIDVLAFHTSPLLTSQQRSADELLEVYRPRQTDVPALLQDMKRQLLLVDPAGDVETHARATRLSHDTLAPLVRRRFDDSDRPGQRARRILEARAVDWRDERGGTPLDGPDLEVVERGLIGMRAPTTSEERLLAASRVRRRQEQRRRRILQITSAAVIAAIMLSAVISVLLARRAERERRRAVSAARTVQAREALESDPALAAQILADLQGYPESADGGRTAHLVLNERIPVAILRGHAAPIRMVAISPDGQHVVTTSDDGTARIWRLDNTANPIELDHRDQKSSGRPEARSFVLGGVYDPGGARIVTYALDAKARLWKTDGTRTPEFILPHENTVDSAAFNESGTLLLTTTARNPTAQVWNVRTGEVLYSLRHPAPVVSAAFGRPPLQHVLTLAGGQLRLWTLQGEGHAVERLIPIPDNVSATAAAFASGGTSIAAGGRDGRVWLLPATGTGKPGSTLKPPADAGPLQMIRTSPDGRQLAIAWTSAIRVWTPDDDRQISIDHPRDVTIRHVVFSRNGAFIATSAGDGRVWLWPRTSASVGPATELRGHSGRVESLDFTRDGEFLVTGSSDRTARVWRTGATEPEAIARFRPESTVTLDSRGRHAVTVKDGALSLWRITDGGATEVSSAPGKDHGIRELHVTAGGSHLVTISKAGTLRVWRPVPQTDRLESILERDRIATAALTPDGSSLRVIDVDGNVRDWRPGAPWPDAVRPIRSKFTSEGQPTMLAVNSSGSRVVTGTREGIYVWNVDRMDTETRPATVKLPPAGDTAAFATFNRDGSRVLIVDVLGVARVFSSDGTGTPIVLTAERLQTAAFDDDGSHVVGVTADGRTLRWRIGWDALIGALATAATACLTPEQRIQLFGEQPQEARDVSQACEARRSR